MSFFGIKRKKSKIDLFIDGFKNVSVWDRGAIETNYGKRLPELLTVLGDIARAHPSVNFLILFSKEELRKSWYSENQGKVVVNTSFSLIGPEFRQELQKAIKDFKEIELELGSSK